MFSCFYFVTRKGCEKMRKRICAGLLAAVALTAVLLLTGCGGNDGTEASAGGETVTVTDSKGREVEVPEKVERVVCVGVGALRYTCYMDAEELVVGVEDYEHERTLSRPYNYVNYELFSELPVIGVKDEPDAELLLAADPDVIVMSEATGTDADELQQKVGIPVITIGLNDEMIGETAYETFRIMGEVYGREERAQELTDYLDDIKADLDERTADVQEDGPAVYIGGVSYKGLHGFEGTEAGYGPLSAIHAKNLVDETGRTGAFNIELEQVLAWDPDIIFIDLEGLKLINEHYETTPEYYEQLQAVKNGRVYSQISYRSSASNLETALADTYYAGTVIYPEQFEDVDPAAKADEIFNKLLGTDFYGTLKENGYEFKEVVIGQR